MNRARRKLTLVAALALALSVGAPVAAEAKKAKTFSEQKAEDAAIPPTATPGVAATPLVSELKVPKKFKGKAVGDVNVTSIQTTGSAPSAADDLFLTLSAPNGRTVVLLSGIGDQSIGPLTLDDDTPVSVCNALLPPCEDSRESLNRPFAGTANLLTTLFGTPGGPLSNFNGIKMRGTWTLRAYDDLAVGTNSTLNQWGLRIKPAKPIPE